MKRDLANTLEVGASLVLLKKKVLWRLAEWSMAISELLLLLVAPGPGAALMSSSLARGACTHPASSCLAGD